MICCDFCEAKFCKSHAIAFAVAEDIVSNFRIICVAALTAPLFIALSGAATAQTAPAGQSGSASRYLAGLRPPHEHQKSTHPNANRLANTGAKTSSKTNAKLGAKPATKPAETAGKATAKTATNTKRARLATAHSTAHSTVHAPHRMADKIAARIGWPRADSVAAEDRREERADAGAMPQTALQFAADDTRPNAQSSAQSKPVAASAPKPSAVGKAPTPQAAAPDDGQVVAPVMASAASEPPATSKVVQLERFAPPQSQSLSAALVIEDNQATRADHNPRSGSSTAQALTMLAGAISAALAGWWIFGFGSARRIKVRAYS
jgi:hypothetical protein